MKVTYNKARTMFNLGHTVYITSHQDTIGLSWSKDMNLGDLQRILSNHYHNDSGLSFSVATSNNVDRSK